MPPTTLGALLDERASDLIGRDRDRAVLLDDLVHADVPLVAVVHGVAGIGKSSLVQAFAADAREAGAAVVTLDARDVEPTPEGFTAALASACGVSGDATVAEAAAALGALGGRVVLALDTYELFAMLDGWLSGTFAPRLPVNVRVLLVGRGRPSQAWLRRFGGLLTARRLGPLSPSEAEAILHAAGVHADVNRLAQGHPLALQLAASAARGGVTGPLTADSAVSAVGEGLAQLYLDHLDAGTRRALDAASVTRRMTRSLLADLLAADGAGEDADDALERLRALPFVDLAGDGLVVHDTIREVVGGLLRAADPARHRRLRTAAWHHLRGALRDGASRDLWRTTTDLLYLVEEPIVRQFFFPVTVLDCAVERARPADWPAIRALADAEDEMPADLVGDWWEAAPHAFSVVRDAGGEVRGFSVVAERGELPASLLARDPLTARWREHLRRDPVPPGHEVVFLRYLVTREPRRSPSLAQAALLLDLKRAYVARRPRLRRAYAPAPVLAGSDGLCAIVLGYVPLPGEGTDLPPAERSLFNDFGPGSIDGWLADLAARELDVADQQVVDPVLRRLVLDGRQVELTQLEFDVLHYLHERSGQAVGREALLRDVWGYEWTGGSNVVEVAVSSLRRKLGDRARAVQTVRGVGYRLDTLT